MKDLIGDFGSGLKVPGDEGTVCWVSTDRVTAAHKLLPPGYEKNIQGLLYSSLVCSHHLGSMKWHNNLTEGFLECADISLHVLF